MGLKRREDEFSFVKLASLQERTTQGCRFTKKNAMGETKNKLCSSSKPSSLKLCMETSEIDWTMILRYLEIAKDKLYSSLLLSGHP